MRIPRCMVLLILTLAGIAPAVSQDAVDGKLMAEISRIRAIDNHTHVDPADPLRGQGWNPAKPLGEPRYPDVAPLRRDNPEWLRAWKALYGYRHSDFGLPNLQALLEAKRGLMRMRGEAWPRDVLDRAGIDIALVNATQLGPGQTGDRFRWVPYADPLLWPFAGDRSFLRFTGGVSSNAQLLREAGLTLLPRTLSEYRARVVEATLSRWATSGAVAVKFLSAYIRPLQFERLEPARAAELYSKGVGGAALTAAEQKAIEDYLFTEIAVAAGTQSLVVQIHTGNGDGPYFNNQHANPGQLENALGSVPLRKTNFVLVHGGWPFTSTAQAMLDKPNTYADFSAQTFYLTTHALAEVLRNWLGWHPEKVLFGTDSYSDVDSPLTDYEEKQWLMTFKARQALAIALTAMMRGGEISRPRAVEIARMVMRENAMNLYRLTAPLPAPATR